MMSSASSIAVLVIAIPYITTRAELRRRKLHRIIFIAGGLSVFVAAMVIAYFVLPPLDLVIAKARVGLFK